MKIIAFLVGFFCAPAWAASTVIAGQNASGHPEAFGSSAGQMSITLLAGEDETNDVIKAEAQYNVCIDDADIVCKSSAGFVHSVWCYGEDAAATAGRVRLLNATAAGAAETTEVWGAEFAAAIASPSGQILDVIMDTGIVIDWTTTADVKCGVSYR